MYDIIYYHTTNHKFYLKVFSFQFQPLKTKAHFVSIYLQVGLENISSSSFTIIENALIQVKIHNISMI